MTLRSQDYKNLVVEIYREDYDNFVGQLHYGQLSTIFRRIFDSLNTRMNNEGKRFLYEWLDGEKPLILHAPEEHRKYEIPDEE